MDFQPFQANIASLAKKHNLDAVVLFGSQATGRVHTHSDIDIAVLGKQDFGLEQRARLAGELSELFKQRDVEVIDLRSASPTLMHVVVQDGRALYEVEPDTFFRWKLYAIKIWMETAWLRELRDKKLINWAQSVPKLS